MPPCAYLSLRSLHHACLTFHNFKGHQVRHVMIEGEPWFVAADVCRALGLYISDRGQANVTVALRKVEQAETRLYPIQTPVPTKADHVTEMKVVSEPGLYMLIMRSDKPEAATFQDWVTREVLPAIRKTGGYLLNEEARETAAADQRDEMPIPQTYPDALRAFADALERRAMSGRLAPRWRLQEDGKKRRFSAGFRWRDARPPISPHSR